MEIEKNIPVPDDTSDTFKKMEVGDSLLIPCEDHKGKIYSRAKMHFYRSDKKIKARKVDGGIRIWRIQ